MAEHQTKSDVPPNRGPAEWTVKSWTSPLKAPRYRSGLALARAQTMVQLQANGKSPDFKNDGLLTAAEVGILNLSGTRLVTLSACDTGSDESRAGEEVLGLRRGFVQAGARNLFGGGEVSRAVCVEFPGAAEAVIVTSSGFVSIHSCSSFFRLSHLSKLEESGPPARRENLKLRVD